MRSAKGLLLFYRKIVVPSLVLSIVLPLFGMTLINFTSGVGISFFFLLPLFHFLGYEIKYPHEYFFYHNLGLSKRCLWVSTIIISLIVSLFLIWI